MRDLVIIVNENSFQLNLDRASLRNIDVDVQTFSSIPQAKQYLKRSDVVPVVIVATNGKHSNNGYLFLKGMECKYHHQKEFFAVPKTVLNISPITVKEDYGSDYPMVDEVFALGYNAHIAAIKSALEPSRSYQRTG